MRFDMWSRLFLNSLGAISIGVDDGDEKLRPNYTPTPPEQKKKYTPRMAARAQKYGHAMFTCMCVIVRVRVRVCARERVCVHGWMFAHAHACVYAISINRNRN